MLRCATPTQNCALLTCYQLFSNYMLNGMTRPCTVVLHTCEPDHCILGFRKRYILLPHTHLSTYSSSHGFQVHESIEVSLCIVAAQQRQIPLYLARRTPDGVIKGINEFMLCSHGMVAHPIMTFVVRTAARPALVWELAASHLDLTTNKVTSSPSLMVLLPTHSVQTCNNVTITTRLQILSDQVVKKNNHLTNNCK